MTLGRDDSTILGSVPPPPRWGDNEVGGRPVYQNGEPVATIDQDTPATPPIDVWTASPDQLRATIHQHDPADVARARQIYARAGLLTPSYLQRPRIQRGRQIIGTRRKSVPLTRGRSHYTVPVYEPAPLSGWLAILTAILLVILVSMLWAALQALLH
jgi:hypothetical protein